LANEFTTSLAQRHRCHGRYIFHCRHLAVIGGSSGPSGLQYGYFGSMTRDLEFLDHLQSQRLCLGYQIYLGQQFASSGDLLA
jgi:hypothetical protein